MFKFLFGLTIGFFAGFILFIALFVSGFSFDVSSTSNFVIAFGTAIAVVIHYSSLRQQRKDRVWDINKPILLDLSHAIASTIKASNYYLQQQYAAHQIDDDPNENENEKPDLGVYKNLNEKQDYALNVYRTLMNSELINAIENAIKVEANIRDALNYDQIDLIEAYETSIKTYEELQDKLRFFITELSGVKDI